MCGRPLIQLTWISAIRLRGVHSICIAWIIGEDEFNEAANSSAIGGVDRCRHYVVQLAPDGHRQRQSEPESAAQQPGHRQPADYVRPGEEPVRSAGTTVESCPARSDTAKLPQLFPAAGPERPEVDQLPADALPGSVGHVDTQIRGRLNEGRGCRSGVVIGRTHKPKF